MVRNCPRRRPRICSSSIQMVGVDLQLGEIGSDRLRQRVFDDELGEPIPKGEKRKIRELKKKLEKVTVMYDIDV